VTGVISGVIPPEFEEPRNYIEREATGINRKRMTHEVCIESELLRFQLTETVAPVRFAG
jgi:hypothetical protein